MRNEELIELRGQILNDVVPLVIENAENGPDRFGLLLRIIQAGNAKSEVYKHAYESAKMIEDKSQQLDALLSLVDEIDFDVKDEPEVVTDSPALENHDSQPEPLNDNQSGGF